MAIVCSTYLSTRDFNYNPSTNCFTAEASDLSQYTGGMSRVYDDACDEGFVLVSHKSGNSVVMAVDKTDVNDGDIAGWHFKVVAVQSTTPGQWKEVRHPQAPFDFTALIIND